MNIRNLLTTALLIAATSAPALAASLASTSPAQPMPDYLLAENNTPGPEPLDSWTAGSAALVPVNAAPGAAETTGGGGKSVDDVSFVKKATENGRKEVAAARDALPQLKNPELKRIAEMLVNDHGSSNEKLARIADTKGWPVPAPQPAAAPPTGATSGDFDARWTADMIAGHERSIALYRAQAQDGQDADLRNYARDTLPTIEHHLHELRSTQK